MKPYSPYQNMLLFTCYKYIDCVPLSHELLWMCLFVHRQYVTIIKCTTAAWPSHHHGEQDPVSSLWLQIKRGWNFYSVSVLELCEIQRNLFRIQFAVSEPKLSVFDFVYYIMHSAHTRPYRVREGYCTYSGSVKPRLVVSLYILQDGGKRQKVCLCTQWL